MSNINALNLTCLCPCPEDKIHAPQQRPHFGLLLLLNQLPQGNPWRMKQML